MTGPHRLPRAYLILSLALVLIANANAATYKVGDDTGTWTIPATTNDLNYTIWADGINFRFGDELVFKYASEDHNVLLVNQSDYDSCSFETPISSYSSGDDTVTLNLPGLIDYYFVCGSPSHCHLGQKFYITLVGYVPETAVGSDNGPPPPSKSDASPSLSGLIMIKLTLIAAFLMVSFTSTHSFS